MHPNRGGEEILGRLILPHLREIYEDLSAAVLAADLLVTHPLLLVGPIVAEAVAKLARIARPQDWGRFVKDWLTRWNLGRQAKLGRLRQMAAGTARWAVGVTKVFSEPRTEARR